MQTYSFLDVNAAIVGPGIAANLGAGAGASEEGITVEPAVDFDAMSIGSDGSGLHTLIADKSGHITMRYLKTSPINKILSLAAALQRTSSALHGANVISISNNSTGDSITCQQVAFARIPNVTYAKDSDYYEWHFNAITIDILLGGGA